jgi:hypothetical protein
MSTRIRADKRPLLVDSSYMSLQPLMFWFAPASGYTSGVILRETT